MKILRVFDQTIGFDELYEGYIMSQLDKLIVEETQEGYNEVNTTTPRKEVVICKHQFM